MRLVFTAKACHLDSCYHWSLSVKRFSSIEAGGIRLSEVILVHWGTLGTYVVRKQLAYTEVKKIKSKQGGAMVRGKHTLDLNLKESKEGKGIWLNHELYCDWAMLAAGTREFCDNPHENQFENGEKSNEKLLDSLKQ